MKDFEKFDMTDNSTPIVYSNSSASPVQGAASASGDAELPPLPKMQVVKYLNNGVEEFIGYTADQMRAYARAALASTRTASDTRTAAGEAECDAALRAAPAGQQDAGVAVLTALRDGIPLEEPVSITKAVLAQREARVVLSGGKGPVACVMLVNIQLTGWAEGPEKAEAWASGYNTAFKWYRGALIDLARKVSTDAAAGAAAGGNTCKESVTSSSAKNGTKSPETRMDTGFRTDVNSAAEVDVEAESKLFEAAARDEQYVIYAFTRFGMGQISDPPRTYLDAKTEAAWRLWLAARTQADAGKDAEPVKRRLAHGHRDDYYLMTNARMVAQLPIHQVTHMPNWVFASKLFATGSTSARQICIDAGIDPDGYEVARHPTTTKPENT